MILKFFAGILFILAIYGFSAWGIAEIFGFQINQIKGLYFSGILATINVVLAFLIIMFAFKKDAKLFNKLFLGGMVIRMLLMLILIIMVIKLTTVDHFVFIGSLFLLYFVFQIWEVLIINQYYKRG